jgi:hypothetical protein
MLDRGPETGRGSWRTEGRSRRLSRRSIAVDAREIPAHRRQAESGDGRFGDGKNESREADLMAATAGTRGGVRCGLEAIVALALLLGLELGRRRCLRTGGPWPPRLASLSGRSRCTVDPGQQRGALAGRGAFRDASRIPEDRGRDRLSDRRLVADCAGSGRAANRAAPGVGEGSAWAGLPRPDPALGPDRGRPVHARRDAPSGRSLRAPPGRPPTGGRWPGRTRSPGRRPGARSGAARPWGRRVAPVVGGGRLSRRTPQACERWPEAVVSSGSSGDHTRAQNSCRTRFCQSLLFSSWIV